MLIKGQESMCATFTKSYHKEYYEFLSGLN